MNAQDPVFNTLLDNIATPDKPESPIITGTGSLEDDFTINEAGENADISSEETDSVGENPLLSAEASTENSALSPKALNLAALHDISLSDSIKWDDNRTLNIATYQDKSLASDIQIFVFSLTFVGMGFMPFFIIDDDLFFMIVFSFIFGIVSIFLFYIVTFPAFLRIIIIKHKYKLRITINNDEIIFEENANAYAFPRISSHFNITLTRFGPKIADLCKINFIYKNKLFTPDTIFSNSNAEELRSFVRNVLNANIPSLEEYPPEEKDFFDTDSDTEPDSDQFFL